MIGLVFANPIILSICGIVSKKEWKAESHPMFSGLKR